MQIKKKIVPTLTRLELKNINEVIVDIYREINKVSKSAEEVSFRLNEKGQRELIIQDKDKQYKDVTGTAIFDIDNITSLKEKAKTKIKENLSLADSATIDTTNADNISSGTLAKERVETLNQNTSGLAATATLAAKATTLDTTTNGIVKTSGNTGVLSIGTFLIMQQIQVELQQMLLIHTLLLTIQEMKKIKLPLLKMLRQEEHTED